MTGAGAAILSVLMIAGMMLASGGIWLALGRRDRKKGLLMVAAAAVMFANVVIWTI